LRKRGAGEEVLNKKTQEEKQLEGGEKGARKRRSSNPQDVITGGAEWRFLGGA